MRDYMTVMEDKTWRDLGAGLAQRWNHTQIRENMSAQISAICQSVNFQYPYYLWSMPADGTKRSSHLLHTLQWLPVDARIKYKILLYVFKSLNNQGSTYVISLIFWICTMFLPSATKTDVNFARPLMPPGMLCRARWASGFRWASRKCHPSLSSSASWKCILISQMLIFSFLCYFFFCKIPEYIFCIFLVYHMFVFDL